VPLVNGEAGCAQKPRPLENVSGASEGAQCHYVIPHAPAMPRLCRCIAHNPSVPSSACPATHIYALTVRGRGEAGVPWQFAQLLHAPPPPVPFSAITAPLCTPKVAQRSPALSREQEACAHSGQRSRRRHIEHSHCNTTLASLHRGRVSPPRGGSVFPLRRVFAAPSLYAES
jgi:hypothetical protein